MKPSLRESLLKDAIGLTMGDRNKSYGDPIDNLGLAGRLKKTFYEIAGYSRPIGPAEREALDNIFTKLGRIGTGPTLSRDNYVDLATYAAIAYEVALLTQNLDKTPIENGDLKSVSTKISSVEEPVKVINLPSSFGSSISNSGATPIQVFHNLGVIELPPQHRLEFDWAGRPKIIPLSEPTHPEAFSAASLPSQETHPEFPATLNDALLSLANQLSGAARSVDAVRATLSRSP